jgi:hypothetical protein
VQGHPIFKEVVELIIARAKEGIDHTNPHIVHAVTGPAIWTKAVRRVLGYTDNGASAAAMLADVRDTSSPVYHRAKELGICIAGEAFFTGLNVRNLYGSQRWANDPAYVSWTKEKDALAEKAAGKAKEARL